MASLNKLVVNLSANTAKFDKSMKRSQASIKRMTSSVIRLAGAYVGLRSAKAAIDLARTQAKAEKVLAATLKATGEAAGFSFSQLTRYAAELQKVTNFGDETTISAMAMLSTFKNIKGDVFKTAVEQAMDLTEVFGGGLQDNIKLLGLALNNPIKGMDRLIRKGVELSETEKARVRQLQSQGDLLGAQAVILEAIAGQVGGAARAAADDVTQLANAWGDVGETAGGVLSGLIIPHIQSSIGWLEAIITVVQNFGLVWESIRTRVSLFFVSMGAEAMHFAENWKLVFGNIADVAKTVFSNMASNASRLFSALWKSIRSGFQDEFRFEWGDVLEGVQAKPLPARAKGPLERGLEATLEDQRTQLDRAFEGDIEKARRAPDVPTGLAARRPTGDTDAAAAGSVTSGKKFAGAMAQGTQDAYSAIINATGNKQTEKMGQIVKNGDEANGTLKDILKAIEGGGYVSVSSFGPGL